MNHETIKEWFFEHSITPLNVFTVAMIITEKHSETYSENTTLSWSKLIYSDIIQQLITDGKILVSEGMQLTDDFDEMVKSNIIFEFASIICTLTNNPNLVNEKWVSDNTIGQIKNSCFPCKVKSIKKNKNKIMKR